MIQGCIYSISQLNKTYHTHTDLSTNQIEHVLGHICIYIRIILKTFQKIRITKLTFLKKNQKVTHSRRSWVWGKSDQNTLC